MPNQFFLTSNLVRNAVDFVRSYGTPDLEEISSEQEHRELRYQLLYELHNGIAYDDMDSWQDYKSRHGLYRWLRPIWSHAQQLVDFYAYRIYNGAIPIDGITLPDGVRGSVPFSPFTDMKLAKAANALLTDWNFQSIGPMLVTYTATIGELLVELRDNPETGKVTMHFIWPGLVKEILLDEAENIISYSLEYDVTEKQRDIDTNMYTTVRYKYRREVDSDSIRTYKDGVLHPFNGEPASIPNPYGFVPAVWFRHIKRIGVRGEPAIVGTIAAADEVNSLLSHLIDKTHVKLKSPILVSGNLSPNAMQRAIGSLMTQAKRPFTAGLGGRQDGREELDILEAPQGTRIDTLDIKLEDSRQIVNLLIQNIEKNCPEITVFNEMRGMTQITGPAAARLFGDIEPKFRTIASGYDQQLRKLLQMGIAISGWRLANGDWDGTRNRDNNGQQISGLTEMQQRFAGFNLGSFATGSMNLDILPRQLFEATEKERIDLLIAKKSLLQIVPQRQLAIEAGYREEMIDTWIQEYERQKQEEEMEYQSGEPEDSSEDDMVEFIDASSDED